MHAATSLAGASEIARMSVPRTPPLWTALAAVLLSAAAHGQEPGPAFSFLKVQGPDIVDEGGALLVEGIERVGERRCPLAQLQVGRNWRSATRPAARTSSRKDDAS